jgi:hypothetical protein
MIKKALRPLCVLARLGLLLLALPMLLAACSMSQLFGLPDTKADQSNPWEKPRTYVATLSNTLEEVALGYIHENKAGRLSNADYLAAEPLVKDARQALKDANAALKSASTDRDLAAAALTDQDRHLYETQAGITEAGAVARAAIAEKALKQLRPALDRARGLAVPPPTPLLPGPATPTGPPPAA